MEENGCNDLALLIIITKRNNKTKTGTSHSPSLDPEPLWDRSQVQHPDQPSDWILLFCDPGQPLDVQIQYYHATDAWGKFLSSWFWGEYFKPEKPEDTNGLRSLHLHPKAVSNICSVLFLGSGKAVFSKGLFWEGVSQASVLSSGEGSSGKALKSLEKRAIKKRPVTGRPAVT